ncbi:cytochrome P450 [Amnibacterium flavum]|uniref:cytochrome P450 n=1 Tax=Amnibacterium flavum TaxID=2173173 RepID=UPI001402CD57|nr:cytochrome P450 [Amnibacterium flavum]
MAIPTAPGFDSSLPFLADGYRFLSRTADALGTDAFRTRIALRPIVVVRGVEAARFFYEGGRFDRARALPPTVVHLLQDRGSVQTLEGESHERRKTGFVDLLVGSSEERLARLAFEEFSERLRGLRGSGPIAMHDELPRILTAVALRWAGVPEHRRDDEQRADELWQMVRQAGSFGAGTWRALLLRRRSERWARELIADVRDGREAAVEGTPLAAVARWTGDDDQPLPAAVAAVELLNLLRPIVAVAHFVEFALLALHLEPAYKAAFHDGEFTDIDGFVHEVRRRTPFFPAVAGRATGDLDWHGDGIDRDSWVMLDIYGTNHDPSAWPRPQSFDPKRYERGEGDARNIVAQGAGDPVADHRCPGEPATEALIGTAIRAFSHMRWSAVGPQPPKVRYRSLPAEVVGGLQVRVF